MRPIFTRDRSRLPKAGLIIMLLACAAVWAQTADEPIAKLSPYLSPDDAEIQKLVIRAYEAYVTKATPALLSMFSSQSPYLDQFKAFLEEDNASNKEIRLGIRITRWP